MGLSTATIVIIIVGAVVGAILCFCVLNIPEKNDRQDNPPRYNAVISNV